MTDVQTPFLGTPLVPLTSTIPTGRASQGIEGVSRFGTDGMSAQEMSDLYESSMACYDSDPVTAYGYDKRLRLRHNMNRKAPTPNSPALLRRRQTCGQVFCATGYH